MRKLTIILLLMSFWTSVSFGNKSTEFAGLSLKHPANELMSRLAVKGLFRVDSLELSGHISGLSVSVRVEPHATDSLGCDYVLLSTRYQQGRSQHDDYMALMKWMVKRYGHPHWEGMVRGQRFARWYIDFDHDIVMIASPSTAVEVWFYQNHEKRILDYYAILKYCERHPAPGVPQLSARECAVWKRLPGSSEYSPKAKVRRGRHVTKRSRHVKRSHSKRKSRRRR